MQLDNLLEATLSASDRRKMIQQGNFSKNVAFAIRGDLEKIIKKHINDKEWTYNKQFLDQGVQYKGEDVNAANKVIDTIIGDLYGYFIDIPKKEITRVKKTTRTVGTDQQEVYTVTPQEGSPQIEFFKFKNKPELGILMTVAR